MGDISLREIVAILQQYALMPDVVAPISLRKIDESLIKGGIHWRPVSAGVHVPFSCRALGTFLEQPGTLQVISDPPPDHRGATWTSDIVNGHTWLSSLNEPEVAWVQVEAVNEDFDAPVTAVAGTVIKPSVAIADFPFHHPFGNDWECYVDVDPKFRSLLSPANAGSGDSLDYRAATKCAADPLLTGPHQGVLGVEWDSGLVPDSFRPAEGNRIVVFGRWILDAGHKDFHTEIHPPLLMVTASAAASGDVWTTARVISRPYLVSERWPEGSFRNHIAAEIGKVFALQSGRLEAHPTVWAVPFRGRQSMTMVLRTLTVPPAGKTLQVKYALTGRSGVSVAMTPAPPSGVEISVKFDETSYQALALPPRSDLSINVKQLANEGGFGQWLDPVNLIGTILNPVQGAAWDVVSGRGILTDSYTLPQNWRPSLPPALTSTDVANLGGAISMTVNDQQPFPLFGSISVGWT